MILGKPLTFVESVMYAFTVKDHLKEKDMSAISEQESVLNSEKEIQVINITYVSYYMLSLLFQDVTFSSPVQSAFKAEGILKHKESLGNEEEPKKFTTINNASVIITDQGNVHVLPPTEKSAINKDLSKFKRAYSQSQIGISPKSRGTSFLGFKSALATGTQLNEMPKIEDNFASDFYIYSLLWACAFMIFWKNPFLLPILPVPILIYTIKHVGIFTGFWDLILKNYEKISDLLKAWCTERCDAIMPMPVRGLSRISVKANTALKNGIKDSIDTVASCVVIFGLIIFVLCGSVFVIIQVICHYSVR